jgi:hypothetical protein
MEYNNAIDWPKPNNTLLPTFTHGSVPNGIRIWDRALQTAP